jgi:hypothetical protein
MLEFQRRATPVRWFSLQYAVEEFESVGADPSVHFPPVDLVRVSAERARDDFTQEVASGEERVVHDVGDNLEFSVRNGRCDRPRVEVWNRLVILRADDDATCSPKTPPRGW